MKIKTKIEKFEDIIAWQKAKELTTEIFDTFKNNRNYHFRDQIQRASVSIMNNIAEGYERQTNKEFKQFLYIAKGSCGEVRSMLYIAVNLKYITPQKCRKYYDLTIEISKILYTLIQTL